MEHQVQDKEVKVGGKVLAKEVLLKTEEVTLQLERGGGIGQM